MPPTQKDNDKGVHKLPLLLLVPAARPPSTRPLELASLGPDVGLGVAVRQPRGTAEVAAGLSGLPLSCNEIIARQTWSSILFQRGGPFQHPKRESNRGPLKPKMGLHTVARVLLTPFTPLASSILTA